MNSFDKDIALMRALIEQDIKFKYKLKGTSMIPTIFDGDYVIINKVEDMVLNNLYLYEDIKSPTKRLVCHRLVKIEQEKLFFKGDNRNQLDLPINKCFIIGKVNKVIRQLS